MHIPVAYDDNGADTDSNADLLAQTNFHTLFKFRQRFFLAWGLEWTG